ncbi:hypothetical protein [Acinetobacter qingfengensis]|nr:hypothetical protein [Acinetobacter qingfengensis]
MWDAAGYQYLNVCYNVDSISYYHSTMIELVNENTPEAKRK